MNEQISLFDLDRQDELQRQLQLDAKSFRQLRNDLCKRFLSDDVVLNRFPAIGRIHVHPLKLVERHDSTVDGATKLLFRNPGGLLLETVILRTATGRTTLCVSSQIGCAAACEFCATGKMGVARNLSAAEIVDQFLQAGQLLAIEQRSIRNIVFMGMGEPFHNEEQVHQSLQLLAASQFFHHSLTKILISTVGIPAAMLRCAQRFPAVHLALSLHTVRQSLRERLLPLAKRYPLELLRDTIARINRRVEQPIMIEYLLLAGLNDSLSDAEELAQWLDQLNVHVNLIPYNPIADAPQLKGTDRAQRERFSEYLKQRGYKTTIRYSLGSDIAAACGQLVRREQGLRRTVLLDETLANRFAR